jgi:hypothetical protein
MLDPLQTTETSPADGQPNKSACHYVPLKITVKHSNSSIATQGSSPMY